MIVYLANHNDLNLENNYEKYYKYLTHNEKSKINSFKFNSDKARSLLGILLIKSLAIKYGCPKPIVIEKNRNNKPYINNNLNYYFNISHSKDIVCIAVANNNVGIDIEYKSPINLSIYKTVYEDYDKSKITIDKFYEIWTIKESFFKEEGFGLLGTNKLYNINYKKKEIYYKNQKLNFNTYNYDNYKICVCSKLDCRNINYKLLEKEELIKLFSILDN